MFQARPAVILIGITVILANANHLALVNAANDVSSNAAATANTPPLASTSRPASTPPPATSSPNGATAAHCPVVHIDRIGQAIETEILGPNGNYRQQAALNMQKLQFPDAKQFYLEVSRSLGDIITLNHMYGSLSVDAEKELAAVVPLTANLIKCAYGNGTSKSQCPIPDDDTALYTELFGAANAATVGGMAGGPKAVQQQQTSINLQKMQNPEAKQIYQEFTHMLLDFSQLNAEFTMLSPEGKQNLQQLIPNVSSVISCS